MTEREADIATIDAATTRAMNELAPHYAELVRLCDKLNDCPAAVVTLTEMETRTVLLAASIARGVLVRCAITEETDG